MMELTVDLAITYASLLIMALVPIYLGSHWSLKQKGIETMSSQDAWMFPFIGSGVLFGLYVLFRVFSKEYINMLLTAYFLCFGVIALAATITPVFSLVLPPSTIKKVLFTLNLRRFYSKFKDPIRVRLGDSLSAIIAVGIVIWYASGKHWIANNILGLSFAIQGVSFLSVGNYKIGCTLLSGLFLYDIFWVFGTDVMVTVAKSFDAPIKLLFPKNLITGDASQYSMLGLGDIVIPGIFIALLLRFDSKKGKSQGKSFSKVYFFATFIGYIVGLATTMAVMHIFEHAQPALLYLVPACMGFSFFTAVARGEVNALLSYTEEAPTDKKKSKGNNASKEQDKRQKKTE
jgi:minor histocompatibility antigen H13